MEAVGGFLEEARKANACFHYFLNDMEILSMELLSLPSSLTEEFMLTVLWDDRVGFVVT